MYEETEPFDISSLDGPEGWAMSDLRTRSLTDSWVAASWDEYIRT
ncbi:MAG: hypothetical protein ACP5RH_13330 [Leptodesmis sp.]|nr:hypothetical protein [Leptodesmis sichuanensis]